MPGLIVVFADHDYTASTFLLDPEPVGMHQVRDAWYRNSPGPGPLRLQDLPVQCPLTAEAVK